MGYPIMLSIPFTDSSTTAQSRYAYVGDGNYANANTRSIASYSWIMNRTYEVIPRASSADVRAAQQTLNRVLGAGLRVDGVHGPNTAEQLVNFQVTRGLMATGVLDTATRRALASASGSVSSGGTSAGTSVLPLGLNPNAIAPAGSPPAPDPDKKKKKTD